MDASENPDLISEKAAQDARDWVVRLSSGRMTEAEFARFKTWRAASEENARAFVRERAFWQQLGALDIRVEHRPQRPASLSRRALVFGGSAVVAASVAVVAAPRIKIFWQADYRTAAGEQKEVSLADGTRVTLNTDSALAVRYRSDLRLVELLHGEAMFDVRTNSVAPFRVSAFGGNIDAVTGGFGVRALDEEATVTVMSGEVRVAAPAAEDAKAMPVTAAVTIKPDEQTQYRRGGAPNAVTSIDPEQVLAWRTGRVIFEGRPFAEAIAELGRYLPERIVLVDRRARHDPVSAVFSIRQADAAVAALAETQGLTARRIPGVMIVIS
jgi:transmembrane sensor